MDRERLSAEVVVDAAQALATLDNLDRALADITGVHTVTIDAAGVTEAEQAAGRLDEAIRDTATSMDLTDAEAQQVADSLGEAAGAADDTAAGARRTADAASNAADQGGRLEGAWARIATRALAAATAALSVRQVLTAGWERFTAIEDAATALTIQLEDSADAARLLDAVLDTVRGTPFRFETFSTAASQLVAMGVEAEKIPGLLEAIGEAAATRGGRATEFAERLVEVFGQITTTGRISGEQVTRLGEAGVNALGILANSFDVTTDAMREMISEGAVPADQALDLLAQGIVEGTDGIAGSTVALGGTMEGLRETLSGASGGVTSALSRFGEALIDAVDEQALNFFNDTTDSLDDMTAVVDDLAPLLGVAADGFGLLTANIEPVVGLLGEAADGLNTVLGLLPASEGDSFIEQTIDDLGLLQGALPFAISQFNDLRDVLTQGFTEEGFRDFLADLAESAEDTADPVQLLTDVFNSFNEEGGDGVAVLEDLAGAAGLSDSELRGFIQSLLIARDQLGLTVPQVGELRRILSDLGGQEIGSGALIGFDQLAGGINELNTAATSLAVEGADRALLNFASGVDAVADTSGLPTVIRDLGDLAFAAAEAETSILGFVQLAAEDDLIRLDLSGAEQELLGLISRIGEATIELQTTTLGAFQGLEEVIDEETGEIIADTENFINELLGLAERQQDFEVDLSQIQVIAPDLAQILADQGVGAAEDIAAAFALDPAAAERAQEILDGTAEELAGGTAEAFAGFLATLTPQEVADLAVFGAENFLSNTVRGQLAETGQEAAEAILSAITDNLDGALITPTIVIDLSLAEIRGLALPNISAGGTGSSAPAAGGDTNVTVNSTINNPTTQDLDTSAAQAAQNVAAVSSAIATVE